MLSRFRRCYTSLTREADIVFVLGPPGSGKGTLSARLASDSTFTCHRRIHHLSVGDQLRHLKAQGKLSDRETRDLDQNKLAPGATLAPILLRAFEEESEKSGADLFVVDGFPRNEDQWNEFAKKVKKPSLMVVVECSKETTKQRFLGREDATRPQGTQEVFEERYAEFLATERYLAQHFVNPTNRIVVDSEVSAEASEQEHIDIAYDRLKLAMLRNPKARDMFSLEDLEQQVQGLVDRSEPSTKDT